MLGAALLLSGVSKQLGLDPKPLQKAQQSIVSTLRTGIETIQVEAGSGIPVQENDRVTIHIEMSRGSTILVNTRERGLPYSFIIGSPGAPSFLSAAMIGLKTSGMKECVVPGSMVAQWNGGMYGTADLNLKVWVLDTVKTSE